MRISDWSSDVCSSDLCRAAGDHPAQLHPRRPGRRHRLQPRGIRADRTERPAPVAGPRGADRGIGARLERSEEHTSELQSLMRISYAVFCLKKKTIYRDQTEQHKFLQQHSDIMYYLRSADNMMCLI